MIRGTPYPPMKLTTLLTITATLFFTAAAQAEPKSPDEIVDILHKALKAEKPLPLLKDAQDALEAYRPKPKGIAARPRAKGAIKAEAVDRKEESMQRIKQAIEEAKAGRNAKGKIEATIADVRNMGALKK